MASIGILKRPTSGSRSSGSGIWGPDLFENIWSLSATTQLWKWWWTSLSTYDCQSWKRGRCYYQISLVCWRLCWKLQNPCEACTLKVRGPRMGAWIRHGWISRFGGAPIFSPEVPKPFKICILGPLDWKSGCPKTQNPTTTDPTTHSRPSDFKDLVHLALRKFANIFSGVAPANQTEESKVCKLPGKESGTGSGTPFCLWMLYKTPKTGSSGTNSGLLPGKFSNLTFFGLVCRSYSWFLRDLKISREQKRHIKLLHIKFSGRLGHRSSRSGTRTKRFMFLGFRG